MAIKTIKLAVDAPVLPGSGSLTHLGTSYEVSRIPDFTIREEVILSISNSAESLLEHRFTYDLQPNESLYVRTMYHFTGGAYSNWSKIIPLQSDQVGIKMSSTIINTPRLTSNIDYSSNLDGILTIETSEMTLFSGAGSHTSTSWVLEDVHGNTKFKRDNDVDNLTSISIGLDLITPGKIYIAKAIHHNATNASSNQGKVIIAPVSTVTSLFNLTTKYPLVKNKWMYFTLTLNTTEFKNIDIVIVDSNGNIVAQNLGQVTRTPRLFTGELIPFNNYTVKARLNLIGDTPTEYKNILSSVIRDNTIVDYNTEVTYLDKLSFNQPLLTGGPTTQVTRELESGFILLAKHNTNMLYNYRLIDNKLVEMGPSVAVGDHTFGKPVINVIPLYDGRVLVDYTTNGENGVWLDPVFQVFEFNPVTYKLTLSHINTRQDERYSTAVSTSAIAVDDGIVYYIPSRIVVNDVEQPLTMRRYDTNNNTMLPEIALPFTALSHVSMGTIENGLFYVMGGCADPVTTELNIDTYVRSNDNVYSYDTNTDTWEVVSSIAGIIPNTIYNLQLATRRDYKITIFNGTYTTSSVEDQSTYLFNPHDGTIVDNNNDTLDDLMYNSVISLRGGDIMRLSNRTLDPQTVYTYVSNTIGIDEVTDQTLINVVNDLIVPIGETITIESPYRYSSITILGDSDTNTGTLRWLDGDVVHTFLWNDLLVTRPLEYINDLYTPSREWDSITILDDASFDIVNVLHIPDNTTFNQLAPFTVSELTIGNGSTLTISPNPARTITNIVSPGGDVIGVSSFNAARVSVFNSGIAIFAPDVDVSSGNSLIFTEPTISGEELLLSELPPLASRDVVEFTSTGENTFPVSGGFNPSSSMVFIGGKRMVGGSVDISSGTDIVFTDQTVSGEVIRLIRVSGLSFTETEYISTGGETVITVGPYTPESLDVWLQGVLMYGSNLEYTSATEVTLLNVSPLEADEIVTINKWSN